MHTTSKHSHCEYWVFAQHCLWLSVIRFISFSFTFFRTATFASNFLICSKRSLISLDIAEIFEPILASALRNNCTNYYFLSLLSTASVSVPAISTISYNLMKNKSIILLTRQLSGKILAFYFFFYTRPHSVVYKLHKFKFHTSFKILLSSK